MKIVCDSCGTKYSIADEKVKGKVFKIRCKKCSHVIVVRSGEAGASEGRERRESLTGAEDPPTTVSQGASSVQVSDSLQTGTWHVVVNGQQVGPLSATELRGKFAAGEVDLETYIWKDGMADWTRLGSVAEFRDLAAENPFADDGATKQSDRNVLFANDSTAAEATAADVFNRAGGARGVESSLFAAPVEAPTTVSTPAYRSSGVSPAALASGSSSEGGKPLTAQRNESSVLFSLNNLSALGGNAGPNKPAPAQQAGFANSQTEGSGLIDIRAMAAATLAKSPSVGARSDSLPGIPSAPVFSTMSAPILLPAAPAGPPKWLWGVVALAIIAVLGFIGVGVLFFLNRPAVTAVAPSPAAPAPVAAPATGTAPTSAALPAPGAPAPAAAPVAAAPAPAAPVAAAATPAAADKKPSKDRIASKPGKPSAPVGKAPEVVPPPVSDAKKVASAKRNTSDAIDDLLNRASPESSPKRAAREEPAAEKDDGLPEQLDKSAIISGMSKIKGKVLGCYDQYKSPGQANVSVSIARSGKVSSATVTGAFDGTPTGSCIERAVKTASFPPFKGATQTITYPFVLR